MIQYLPLLSEHQDKMRERNKTTQTRMTAAKLATEPAFEEIIQ